MDSLSGAFIFEGGDKILIHFRELRRESRDGGCELRNGGVVTCRGRHYVFDGVHRFLLEVPVVWNVVAFCAAP